MARRSHITTAAATLAAAATLIALAGCGAPGGDTESDTLTFITYQGGDAGVKYENLVAAFEEANPGVTVELEILTGDDTYNTVINSRISGGTSPDLFEVLNGVTKPFIEADLLTDLSDQPWVEQQVPAVRNLAERYDGTFAFVPEIVTGGVFYNTEIFEANGVEVPSDWDGFMDAIATFRAAGVTPLAVGAKDGWPFLQQWQQMFQSVSNAEEGAALDSGELAYSDSSAAGVVQAFADMVEAGAFDPNASGIDWPSSANDFAAGKTAMMIQGTFALPAIRTASPDGPFSMFPMPYSPDGNIITAPGSVLAIPSTAPNAELAKRFLEFWAAPENHSAYLTDAAAFSSFLDSAGELDPALDELAGQLADHGIDTSGMALQSAAINTAIQSGFQGILVGTATVDSVLAEIDAAQAAG